MEMVALTGGRTVEGGASNVPKWKKCLEERSRAVTISCSATVRDEHMKQKAQNPTRCHRCRRDKYRLDFCEFLCTPDRRQNKSPYKGDSVPHRFCSDCVSALLKTQARQFPRGGEHVALQDLLLVCCPLCRSPNVLKMEHTFYEGFERQDNTKNGVMKTYAVHQGATRVLGHNYFVEECYENQRRPPFGVFSKENLLEIDWCGPFSTQGATAIGDTQDREEHFSPPNRSWVWLEPWNFDITMGGAFGWMFARKWPKTNSEEPESGWDRVISLFHLVRRRRLLRTRIRLNENVTAELDLIRETETEERAEKERQ